MSRRPWSAGSIVILMGCTLGGLALAALPRRVAGQESAPAEATAIDQAIRQAMATHRDLIVILTSDALPHSRQFYRDFMASDAARNRAPTAVYHELVAEQEPARTRQLAATALPSVFVFRLGERGMTQAGRLAAPKSVEEVGRWLGLLNQLEPGNALVATAEKDEEVSRASHGYGHDHLPRATPQAGAPQAPPHVMQPPPAAPPAMAPPTVGMGIPQPAIVVPTPSPSVYVQQQPPTIVVGTPSTANVVYANNLGAPSIAAPTLGVPSAPAAAPSLGFAPTASMVAPVQMLGTAPAGQSQVVGLILERPGFGRRLLGALGRELSSLSNPRVRMASMPEFAQMPIPTTSLGVAPPAQRPAIVLPPEQPDLPSPQQETRKKHGFFHHD